VSAAEILRTEFDRLLAANGPPTPAHGDPPADDARTRLDFGLSARIADLTGLDFVQLVTVEYYGGGTGLEPIIGALGGGPPCDQARRAYVHWAATFSSNPQAVAAMIRLYTDPALDGPAQRSAWLQAFLDGFSLRVPRPPSTPCTPERQPIPAQIAELTGLPFEPLALIERKGGRAGLRHTLRSLPHLPGQQAAIQACA